MHAGLGDPDIARRCDLQRLIPLQHGACLCQHRFGLIERRCRGKSPLLQIERPVPVKLTLLQLSLVNQQCASGCIQVLTRRFELPLLHVQARFSDRHLLAIVACIDDGEHRPLTHPLALIERQFDNARLHGLEAQYAHVRFDVAGKQQDVGIAGGTPELQLRRAKHRHDQYGNHGQQGDKRQDDPLP